MNSDTDDTGAPWWGCTPIAARQAEEIWAIGPAEITYARLRHEVASIRRTLREQGVTAGSSVALKAPPSFEVLWWLFALWAEKAQVLLLDSRMKTAEAEDVLALVCPEYQVISRTELPPLTAFAEKCDLEIERVNGGRPGDADLALIMCSSGSSGAPKIVGRTGRSLLAEVDYHAANPVMTRPGERVYLLGSPLHIFGLTVGVLLTLRIGATLVFPHRFHPGDLLDRARHARVNVVLGVPAHFDMLSQAAGDDRPDALRLAVSAGDVLTDAVKHRFERRYDVGVGQIYGMSECGAIATDLTGEFTHPVVGRLLPGIEPRITEGELYLRLDRSPYPFAEHSGRYADGWLRTYDRAALDPATAVLTLLGRADAVRIIGGLKVDLTEVEALLREHPKVTEALVVLRTAKDNDSPPMLEAYVAGGDLVADELAAWCRSRLSTFKVPRRWHIGADIPRTALGKPDRRVQEREPR